VEGRIAALQQPLEASVSNWWLCGTLLQVENEWLAIDLTITQDYNTVKHPQHGEGGARPAGHMQEGW
jgi:hypothetical protein